MKTTTFAKTLTAGALLLAILSFAPAALADTNDAAAAWSELKQAVQMLEPPAAWHNEHPTREQISNFYAQVSAAAAAAAGKAKEFYTRFPNTTNAVAAELLECQQLQIAFAYGGYSGHRDTNLLAECGQAQATALADPRLTDDDRFNLRLEAIGLKSTAAQLSSPGTPLEKYAAYQAENERCLRELIKDYPHREQLYTMLLNLAANSPEADARRIIQDVLAFPISTKTKSKADGILRRLNGLGKPLDIKFTAVDGRSVDLSQMKGKVVLVDFWATWCGPCVGELPHVKATYDKFHSRGFEIVSISFDSDKDALTRFIKKNNLPWPQYFDGQGWGNKFGQQYGIASIPTMWLVDKKGNFREENAREDLAGKVESLLAE